MSGADGSGVLIPDKKWVLFLAALASHGNITKACEHADICRMSAYNRRRDDAEFSKIWDEAKKIGGEAVLDEIQRRGVDGWDDPLSHQGKLTGHTVRKFDTTLLIFYAKILFPELRDNRLKTEHSGAIDTGFDLSKLPTEKLRELRELLEAAKITDDPEPG